MNNRGALISLSALLEKGLSYMAVAAVMAVCALILMPMAMAQDMMVTVQLTTPLKAKSVHKGDAISVQVTSPASLNGDTMQGKVAQVKLAGGQSTVQFTFDSIRHAGVAVPITADIQGVSNSRGQPGADDQGQSVTASNVAAKAGGESKRSRFGGQLGGLVGGTAGEAASEASDDTADTKGSAAVIQIAAQGMELQFAPGATLTVSVRSTGSPDLASLTPNAPAKAPVVAVSPVGQSAGAASVVGAQPELKSTKIEFVPGERTILFDDFSDMVADEPPPHWKVREGTVELRTAPGVRELYAKDSVQLTSPTVVVPVNFTFEVDWSGGGQMTWHFQDKENNDILIAMVRGEEDGMTASTTITGPGGGELGSGMIETDTNKPVKFALWAQQGRVRAYIEGQRLVDANQVEFGPMDHIYVEDAGYRPNGLRSVRVAESAPDFSTVINASGKFVTHGINFDTDSDHLKPESSAVLKEVAAGLGKNPNLKLEIDGYTDSVGDGAHNLDLSKRRAIAVQTVLVSQFGIEAGRLTSGGFGAAKPIGSNDTPDGRAANRRVEFLKK